MTEKEAFSYNNILTEESTECSDPRKTLPGFTCGFYHEGGCRWKGEPRPCRAIEIHWKVSDKVDSLGDFKL
jgi:hypothetical protein